MIKVEYDFTTLSYKVIYEDTDGKGYSHLYNETDAMALVEGLTRAGVASLGKDNADNEYQRGFLTAQTAHLEDLRRLTFLENDKGEI